MGTLAIVSRKGGSGKSTLATNLAAYLARRTASVTLGDLDRQQSMRVWLSRRPSAAPLIVGWVGDSMGLARPVFGTEHLVLDTPGGLHGIGLAKVIMSSHAVLLPVGGSVFDRESASDCWSELRSHPKIISGKCRIAAVGMRIDSRTGVEQITADWAASVGIPYLTSLRMAQIYVRAVENGISIFDMPDDVGQADRNQWASVLSWVEPTFFPKAVQVHDNISQNKFGNVVLIRPLDSWAASGSGSRLPQEQVVHHAERPSVLSRLLPSFLARKR